MRLKQILFLTNHMEITTTEKYSRGRRGAPAKGVGRATGARVQIPLSPLYLSKREIKQNLKKLQKINKKVVDKHNEL